MTNGCVEHLHNLQDAEKAFKFAQEDFNYADADMFESVNERLTIALERLNICRVAIGLSTTTL